MATNRHGGARPGAGGPPKALLYADTAAQVEPRIADALPDITDALIEAAVCLNQANQTELET